MSELSSTIGDHRRGRFWFSVRVEFAHGLAPHLVDAFPFDRLDKETTRQGRTHIRQDAAQSPRSSAPGYTCVVVSSHELLCTAAPQPSFIASAITQPSLVPHVPGRKPSERVASPGSTRGRARPTVPTESSSCECKRECAVDNDRSRAPSCPWFEGGTRV